LIILCKEVYNNSYPTGINKWNKLDWALAKKEIIELDAIFSTPSVLPLHNPR